MHRIDSDGSVQGHFSDGNPQTGQRATLVTADWLNAAQEAICRVIEYANIPLQKGDDDQLRDAIVALIAGVVGDGGGSVPTTRRINTNGLLAGGGPLAADLNLSVLAAAPYEVVAGAANDRAVTPLALAAAFGSFMGPSGYYAIPFSNGGFVQWFSAVIPGNATTILTLPFAYTQGCYGVWVNGGAMGYDMRDNPPFAAGWGTSNVSVHNDLNSTTAITLFAIGK